MSRKLDFKSYHIASIQHLPDGERRNYIIQLTWAGYGNFSYKILNADGDNHEVVYYFSDDYYFRALERLEDIGMIEDYSIYVNHYYFVRLQHKSDKKLHTAVINILECYSNGEKSIGCDLNTGDFEYKVISYPFANHFYKSQDYRFELIKHLNMI